MPYPPYTPSDWVEDVTLVDEARLDNIESGIVNATDAVNDLDAEKQALAEKAQANGYASLDGAGKVPLAQLPPVGADLVYNGDYSAGPTYEDGDIVVLDGIAYMCVVPTTTPPEVWPGGPTPTPPMPTIPYGTSLPASPTDGMEAVLVDSVTAPSYQWRFRFNAGSTLPHKWEFVGGCPRIVQVLADEALNASAVAPGLGFPTPVTATLARAGYYLVEGQARIWMGGAAGKVYLALFRGGSPTNAALYDEYGTDARMIVFSEIVSVTAGQVIDLAYFFETAPAAAYGASKMLKVTPLRVA